MTMDFQFCLQIMESCKNVVEDRVKERFSSLELHAKSVSSVLREVVTEHHTFFQQTHENYSKNNLS